MESINRPGSELRTPTGLGKQDGTVDKSGVRAMERLSAIWLRTATQVRAWLARDDVRYPGVWWALSRLWLVAATIIGAGLHAPSVLSRPAAVPLWQTWRRWDADIYAHIAAHGYLAAE